MNERIKQLKEQSMEWVPNMADPDTKIRLLNAEKFAELIVRECAKVCDLYAMPDGTSETAIILAYAIRRKFGVEE
jgi:hypothetical protein